MTEQWYSFNNVQNDDRNGVLTAIRSETSDYSSGNTYTLQALSMGISDFESTNTVSSTDTNLILLLTDGVPTDCPCPDMGLVDLTNPYTGETLNDYEHVPCNNATNNALA